MTVVRSIRQPVGHAMAGSISGPVSGTAYADHLTSGGADTAQEVASRFGTLRVYPERAVHFPVGLPGIGTQLDFCLAALPNPRMEPYKALQSLADPQLAFIVLPLPGNGGGILAPDDVALACDQFRIPAASRAVLLIVSVHRRLEGPAQLSVNARAPLVLDTERQLGWQHIFFNDRYEVRHMLGGSPEDATPATPATPLGS